MEIIGCEFSYRKYIALSPFFLESNANTIIFLWGIETVVKKAYAAFILPHNGELYQFAIA